MKWIKDCQIYNTLNKRTSNYKLKGGYKNQLTKKAENFLLGKFLDRIYRIHRMNRMNRMNRIYRKYIDITEYIPKIYRKYIENIPSKITKIDGRLFEKYYWLWGIKILFRQLWICLEFRQKISNDDQSIPEYIIDNSLL